MSDALRLSFHSSDFADLQSEFALYKQDIRKALDAAAKDTTAIINEDLRDEFKLLTGLTSTQLRNRIKVQYRYENHVGTIWIGLDDIDLKYMRPRQTKSGVTVRKGGNYAGAFISPMMGGGVFRRTSQQRLPVEKLHFHFADLGFESVEKVHARIESIFRRVLDAKLNGMKGRVKRKDIAA